MGEGEYVEDGYVVLPRNVNLLGAGPDATTLTSTRINRLPDNDFLNRLDEYMIQVSEASDQTISGFRIDGREEGIQGGVFVDNADRLVVSDMHVENCRLTGIFVAVSTNSEIINCTLIDNAIGRSANCSGNLQFWSAENMKIRQIYIKESEGAYGIKCWNTAWNYPEWWNAVGGVVDGMEISDVTIDVPVMGAWNNSMSPDISIEFQAIDYLGVEIHHCRVNNTVSLVGYGTGNADRLSVSMHHNIYEVHDWGYAIENNLNHYDIAYCIFINGQQAMAQWEGGRVSNNAHIHHNVFYNLNVESGGNAIARHDGGMAGMRFHHNVVHFSRPNPKPMFRGGGFSNADVRNNIFLSTVGSVTVPMFEAGHSGTIDNNVFYNVNATGTNALQGDPQLSMEGDMPYPYYAPSSASSFVVDKGVDLGYGHEGPAPDIGAFEREGEVWTPGPRDSSALHVLRDDIGRKIGRLRSRGVIRLVNPDGTTIGKCPASGSPWEPVRIVRPDGRSAGIAWPSGSDGWRLSARRLAGGIYIARPLSGRSSKLLVK